MVRKALRRVDSIPQPYVVGTDFGQSFLWYGKNLNVTRTQHGVDARSENYTYQPLSAPPER